MAKVNLTIETNFLEASRDLKRFGEVSENEKKRIETFRKSFSGKEIDGFIERNRRFAAAVQATQGPLKASAAEHRKLQNEITRLVNQGLDPAGRELGELREEYNSVSARIDAFKKENQAAARASKEAAAALAAQNRAAVALRKANLAKAMELQARAARNLSTSLKLVVASTAALAVSGTKALVDYRAELANVNTMVDASAAEFGKLDKKLESASVQFGIQKKELASGVYQALSAGARDLGEAMEIVERSAILGTAGLIENATSVDIVTTAMNAYGKEVVSAEKATDVFFKIIEKGKTNGAQLSQVIGQSISLFASAKIPIEELGAGFATLTKVGVQSAEATTQLNAIVNSFLKPSKALSSELKKIGYASGSAFIAAEGLGGVFQFLQTASDGSLDSLAEMVPNIRALRGALGAAAEDGVVFNDVLAAFQDVSGSAIKAYKKQTEGINANGFAIKQAWVSLKNFAMLIGEYFLPAIASAARKITALTSNADEMRVMLGKALPIIGAVGASLLTFVLITKAAVAVQTMNAAMKALNLTMKANVVVLAISLIVGAAILLWRHWGVVSAFMQKTLVQIKASFKIVGAYISSWWTKAFNAVKIAVISLGQAIIDRALGAVESFLRVAGKLPFIGDKFKGIANSVAGMRSSLEKAKDAAIADSKAKAAAAESNIRMAYKERDAQLASLARVAAARKAEQDRSASAAAAADAEAAAKSKEVSAAKIEAARVASAGEILTFSEKLAKLNDAESVDNAQRMSTFQQFINGRMEQEKVGGDTRLEWLGEEKARILALDTLTNAERASIEQGFTVLEENEIKRRKAAALAAFNFKMSLAKETLGSAKSLSGSLIQIAKNTGGETHALAVADKAISMGQAGVNTALGVTKALATAPPPLNFINAGLVAAAGAAQVAVIASTPIPKAELGGSFEIPQSRSSSTADRVGVMASPGETVSVTPRGESGGQTLVVNVELDGRNLLSMVQEGIDSGEITITNDNIRSA